MINWNNIKARLLDSDTVAINLILITTIVYLIGSSGRERYVKFIFILFGLIIFFIDKKQQKSFYLWTSILIILLIDLCANYYRAANHLFLLVYTTSLVILYLSNLMNYKLFISNLKAITIIVIAFAGLQKFLSDQFISGEYYYYMLNAGHFFKPFTFKDTELLNLFNLNKENIENLQLIDPKKSDFIILKNVLPNIKVIAIYFSWATILLEMVVAVGLLIKPKSKMTHILLISLLLGIFLTRLETGFLSVLTITGFLLTQNLKLKIIYFSLTLLFITFTITKIGFL